MYICVYVYVITLIIDYWLTGVQLLESYVCAHDYNYVIK